MKRICISLLIMIVGNVVWGQQISKNQQRLINNWQYINQDLGGIWEAIRPVEAGRPESVPIWTDVELPHCFNASDAVNPDLNFYQGPGWYRTLIEVDNPHETGRTLLHFEGAGQKTEVYIGFQKAGSHVGGYDEWTVDITDLIEAAKNAEGKIPLSIRCDNSRDLEMIPSDLSDFNVYGGLYRYVNLVYVPENYITQVHIKPEINGKKSGLVNVDIDFASEADMNLELVIKDAQNEIVYNHILNADGKSITHNFEIKKIEHWSTQTPNLYQIEIKTTSINGGQTYTDKFGFREFNFEKNGPFYLNGERLLIRGTHRHEDHAGVAAAMTEEMIRQEMILMKEMGVNFIRLGHYQQSRIVLNLCDSLGIMVWEEIPWCRGGLGGEVYKQQARRMLTNMVNQHYNHPSVIIWGLGNENDWPGDFPEFDKEKIQAFMLELHQLAHKLDNERKTGIRRCDFCKHIVDVYSPSIWAGWYRGKFTEYNEASLKNMKEVDHFLHMEWGGSGHAGRHDEDPDKGLQNIKVGSGTDERDGDASLIGGAARVSKDGNWSETYICNLFDWHLKEQLTMPWLTGAAQWAFKDFSTPVRPENPIPYMNQKGVVQRDFTKKEAYYVFQSYWTDEPMAHIYGHTWETRWGEKDELKLLKVYSNCDEAELFLNGRSLGKKLRDPQNYPAAGLRWETSFLEEKNTVRVVAQKNGEEVIDQISFNYQIEKWGTPTTLQFNEKERNADVVLLEAKVYDENGIYCPNATNVVRFNIVGDGSLLVDMGTWNGSRKIQLYNGRAFIKMKLTGEKAIVSVSSDNLKTGFVTVVKQ